MTLDEKEKCTGANYNPNFIVMLCSIYVDPSIAWEILSMDNYDRLVILDFYL